MLKISKNGELVMGFGDDPDCACTGVIMLLKNEYAVKRHARKFLPQLGSPTLISDLATWVCARADL
jgi:hypothetical protein